MVSVHGEAPGALGPLPAGREEVGEVLIRVEAGKRIAQVHGQRALGEGRPCDAAGLVGDRGDRLRVVGHPALLIIHCR